MRVPHKTVRIGIIVISLSLLILGSAIFLDNKVIPPPVQQISLLDESTQTTDRSLNKQSSDEISLPELPQSAEEDQKIEQAIAKADTLIEQMDVLIVQQGLSQKDVGFQQQVAGERISQLKARLESLKVEQTH